MLSYIWVSMRRAIGSDGRFWVPLEKARVIHYYANVQGNG
jgi:hypothetical protein